MKINVVAGLGIGAAIGIAMTALFLIPMLQPRPGHKGDLFVIGGYVNDISESTIIISQNLQGKINTPLYEQCIDYCGQSHITVKVTYETVLHGCGVQDGLDVKSCLEKLGAMPRGTSVCAYLRLVDGQLYAGPVFLNQTCDIAPQIA